MKIKIEKLLIPVFYGVLYLMNTVIRDNFSYLNLLYFVSGASLGVVLMYLDETYLFKYYLEPHAEKLKLMTRSLLFIIFLLPLGLFIISSTASKLGAGLFLGVVSVLLLELLFYRPNIEEFHSRFLFQLTRKLSKKEIDYFVLIFSIFTFIFIFLTFILGS